MNYTPVNESLFLSGLLYINLKYPLCISGTFLFLNLIAVIYSTNFTLLKSFCPSIAKASLGNKQYSAL